MSEQLKGHGHVTPNADGFLARCGGPSICKVCKAELAALEDRSRVVTTDWLKRIHRDLDACQKLIWANLRGCDPSYYEDAQERLREIDAMLTAAPAAAAADGWIPVGERLPEVLEGDEQEVIVSVKRAHDGKSYSFSARYLNSFPLHSDYEDEPMIVTGWHDVKEHAEYDGWYSPLIDSSSGDEVTHWMPLPAAHRAQEAV